MCIFYKGRPPGQNQYPKTALLKSSLLSPVTPPQPPNGAGIDRSSYPRGRISLFTPCQAREAQAQQITVHQATVHPNKHKANQPTKRSFLGFFLALSKNPTAFYKLFTCLVQAGHPLLLKKLTNGFYKLFHLPRAGRTPPAIKKSLLTRAKWL